MQTAGTSLRMRPFTPKELLTKTMPFVWAKLLLRLIATLLTTGLLALGIFIATRNPTMGIGVIIVSVLISGVANFVLIRVFGYATRVGHIAVLAETVKTGAIPANQVSYGTSKVKERIGTAATFFIINKLIDAAVIQIQNRVANVAGAFGSIPGMSNILKFGKAVIKNALKYVDECCVAWIFYGDAQQSAWKGAMDGITIYAQNWKVILGSAVRTALWIYGATLLLMVVLILIFSGLLSFVGGLWGVLAWFVGVMIALSIKSAFLDSWAMVRILVAFLEVAPTTEIRVDIYGKLSDMSPAFRQIANKANVDIAGGSAVAPSVFASAPALTPLQPPQRNVQPHQPIVASVVFCGECGVKNPAGTRFCGVCGKRV